MKVNITHAFMTIAIALTVFTFTAISATAEDAPSIRFDYTHFGQIPIQHEGRLKPLDSFARIRLKALGNRDYVDGLTALEFLAEALFQPNKALHRPVFEVRNPQIKEQLLLPEDNHYYSFRDLEKALPRTEKVFQELTKKPKDELTKDQQDLMALYDNTLSLFTFIQSVSFNLPLNINIPENIREQLPENAPFNYLTLVPFEKSVEAELKNIVAEKGNNYAQYTDQERAKAGFGLSMSMNRNAAQLNEVLFVIPPDQADTLWQTPWSVVLADEEATTEQQEILDSWAKITKAHREKDAQGWASTTKALKEKIYTNNLSPKQTTQLYTESLYTRIQPYQWTMALYGFAFVLGLLALIKRQKLAGQWGGIALFSGIVIHAGALAARIIILDRPPVGTLYESSLFVALLCAGLAAFLFNRKRDVTILMAGSAAALGLLAISPVLLQTGEHLELLEAVLNTNFWLTTHVLCITAGYGVCIMAACLAHVEMGMRAAGTPRERRVFLQHLIHRTTIFALLLTAVGTALGGIWADQSWGRFWGWDPKENGALLIVLWLIWIQHGRQSGHLNPLAYSAMTAGLNIIVALAWFGVNLLNVGLHSYGFTSGIAMGLLTFCTVQTLIIITLWVLSKRAERKPA